MLDKNSTKEDFSQILKKYSHCKESRNFAKRDGVDSDLNVLDYIDHLISLDKREMKSWLPDFFRKEFTNISVEIRDVLFEYTKENAPHIIVSIFTKNSETIESMETSEKEKYENFIAENYPKFSRKKKH